MTRADAISPSLQSSSYLQQGGQDTSNLPFVRAMAPPTRPLTLISQHLRLLHNDYCTMWTYKWRGKRKTTLTRMASDQYVLQYLLGLKKINRVMFSCYTAWTLKINHSSTCLSVCGHYGVQFSDLKSAGCAPLHPNFFIQVHLYLHSGPLVFVFSTSKSIQKNQSHCVFEWCNGKKLLVVV